MRDMTDVFTDFVGKREGQRQFWMPGVECKIILNLSSRTYILKTCTGFA
jgi:hypothetical protein